MEWGEVTWKRKGENEELFLFNLELFPFYDEEDEKNLKYLWYGFKVIY